MIYWKELARMDLCVPNDSITNEAIVDVIVCGAGPAGLAAATVCARQGLKTLLVEKNGFCGGASVAGLSGTICGLYLTQTDIENKKPKQIVFGFTEEFRSRLEQKGGLTAPQRYADLLEEASVHCLYHTLVTAVTVVIDATVTETNPVNGKRVEPNSTTKPSNANKSNNTEQFMDIGTGESLVAVKLESSAGSAVVSARAFIDASGDAALVVKAGLSFSYGDRGIIQNPTMMFRLSDVVTDDFYEYFGTDTICPPDLTKKLQEAFAKGTYNTPRDRVWVFPTPQKGIFLMNCTQLAGQKGEMLNVIDPEDRTWAEISGRRAAREYHRFFKDMVKGFENSQLIDMGVEVGVRQTRTIVGEECLTNAHVVACTKTDKGIVRSSWPIELHAGGLSKLSWLEEDYYEVPYATLVPKGIDNLIVAGRCLCAEHEALASSRVTAQCFEYGHAAAIATALKLETGCAYKDIDVAELRRRMIANGSTL